MNQQELKNLLPHRPPMLLLDEAYLEEGKAIGIYQVKGDEFFLQGHFPNNPVVPGVILCEILAQTSVVLLQDVASEKTPYFTGLDKVKFKKPVKPGDLIKTEVELLRAKAPFYFAKGIGRVSSDVCITAEFSFALMD